MFRIMLLLCYSLIDTNTIPFYFSLSQIGRAEPRTQRFGLALSFRRFPPHSTSPIPQGTFSTFGLTLSHGQIIYFYPADASARISNDTASTCIASKQLYFRTKVIEYFIKLYYKPKENYTLNSNNL